MVRDSYQRAAWQRMMNALIEAAATSTWRDLRPRAGDNAAWCTSPSRWASSAPVRRPRDPQDRAAGVALPPPPPHRRPGRGRRSGGSRHAHGSAAVARPPARAAARRDARRRRRVAALPAERLRPPGGVPARRQGFGVRRHALGRPELARRYRFVAFDRPGSGYSGRAPRHNGSPAVQADLIDSALRGWASSGR